MLLELLRAGGTYPTSLGEPDRSAIWTNTFRTPLVVQAGTVVELDGAAIATGLSELPIILDDDIQMNCQYVIYQYAYNNALAHCVLFPGENRASYANAGQTGLPNFVGINPPADIRTSTGGPIATFNCQWTIPAGSYSIQGLCEKVTQATRKLYRSFGSGGALASPFSVLIEKATDAGLYYLKFASNSGAMRAALDWSLNHPTSGGALLGSPLGLTLSYDADIASVELQYAHLPIQNTSGDEAGLIIPVFDENTGDPIPFANTVVGDRGGIILTDVGFGLAGQPPWTSPNNIFYILGFAFGDLITPLALLQTQEVGPQDCAGWTGTQLASNILPDTSFDPINRIASRPPTEIATTGQTGVRASGPPISPGVGKSPHYLVEVDLIPPSMVCGDGFMRSIIGLVTLEFTSGGYLYNSVSDAVVIDEDKTISGVTVRLLDPSQGYRPVQGLGSSSAVFLRLDEPDPASLLRNEAPTPAAPAEKPNKRRARATRSQKKSGQ